MNDYSQIIQKVNRLIVDAESDSTISAREKQKSVDRNFEITHRKMITRYIRAKASDEVKAHVLDNVRLDCGLYISTIAETAKDTAVSKKTVIESFKVLQNEDFVRFYKNGIWAVNPKLLRKGTGGKYIGQIRFYYSLQQEK